MKFFEEFDYVYVCCCEIKNNNVLVFSLILCCFEKNVIYYIYIVLYICYLSFDSGDGFGFFRGGGVEVFGVGDFRGRDGKDDFDVVGVVLVRVVKF